MAGNDYFEQRLSDEAAESDIGYDSEAAELKKAQSTTRHGVKRRKLSHTSSESETDSVNGRVRSATKSTLVLTHESKNVKQNSPPSHIENRHDEDSANARDNDIPHVSEANSSRLVTKTHRNSSVKQDRKPGVVYLSSLPPYLKPSALRNLLAQRGFEPITRLFLTPSSRHKHSSKKSSRQLYSEGWVEFASKKTARSCAETLNAQQVGGKKGGFYYDDLWNMKYLKGMAWEELMSGIREERREEEGRRDEERRKIATETKTFVEGVEQGRRLDGMKRKKKLKTSDENEQEDPNVRRTWRQHGLARADHKDDKRITEEAERVLTRIL